MGRREPKPEEARGLADSSERYDLDGLFALVSADPGSPEFPALAEALRRGGELERAREVARQGLDAAPARLAGRVALGLSLLDLDRRDEAREALAAILDAVLEPHRLSDEARGEDDVAAPLAPVDAPRAAEQNAFDPILDITDDLLLSDPAAAAGDLGDDEIDEAFAAAEPQVDEMISPNRMAEQVLLDHAPVDVNEADAVDHDEPDARAEHELDEVAGESAANEIGAASPLFRTATMAELLARQGDAAGAEAIRRELSDRQVAGDLPPAVDAAVVPEWPAPERSADAPASRSGGDGFPGAHDVAGPSRILSTLERWLQNIQRGRA